MIERLQQYHPLVVEGMGGYDTRDPAVVSAHLLTQLQRKWHAAPPQKPLLLITQGDPYAPKGIAAITRHMADALDIPRAMIYLDPHIAAYHLPQADGYNIIMQIAYSRLCTRLAHLVPGAMQAIGAAIDESVAIKNAQCESLARPRLKAYYRDFAMLQEVTKIACKQICGAITIAQTSADISPFSVTGFYPIGLDLGLIEARDMLAYD